MGLGVVLWALSGCHEEKSIRSIEEFVDPAQTPSAPVQPFGVPGTVGEPAPAPGFTPGIEAPASRAGIYPLFDTRPVKAPDGIPAPLLGVYTDKGAAAPDAGIRGLISFPLRNQAALEAKIKDMYDPSGPNFRKYMTPPEFMSLHAPLKADVETVVAWVGTTGLKVERVATNRMLIHFTGTVKQFNDAMGVELRVFERKSPQGGNEPHDVFGLLQGAEIKPPQYVKDRIHAIPALDLASSTKPLPAEAGTVGPPPAELEALDPQEIAAAYDLDDLYALGFNGNGGRIGVTIGATFRMKDIRGFWQHMGIIRADPVIFNTMEAPATRYREGTLDVQWSGAMAPGAELYVYQGPDARNTSMIFTYNEAIARNEVDVITDSFAHREDSEPKPMQEAYHHSSIIAAAFGITVLAASGDTSHVDVPGNSPWVTAVGGTDLTMNGTTLVSEYAWSESGSGESATFPRPWWQDGLPNPPEKRATADLALNSGNEYYFCWLGMWWGNYGTSFASPVMAGVVASVNSARKAKGKPRIGWLNSQMYTDPAVRSTFRDITAGASWFEPAVAGWDYPTGLGAPSAKGLADTLP